MKVHEYQARQLLQKAGAPVPKFEVIDQPSQAAAAIKALGGGNLVVKAQVHAGGRGKAGYVVLSDNPADIEQHCKRMLTVPMVSKQTGPQGIAVRKVLLAPAVEIDKEYYVGMVVDRARNCPVMMVSREGGVEIEEVAAKNPDAIIKEWLHPHLGLQPFQVRRLCDALGLGGEHAKQAGVTMTALAKLFVQYDCSLAEINPLVLTKASGSTPGQIMAIDAKFNFDDNALFRHPDLQEMFDPTEENPNELRAQKFNLSYIALDGNIGCLVNGAGLAMSTMDIIKLHGGEPANFLDVGGSVTPEGAVEAFRIILADPKVKGILVNIFGGIAKCDVIAEALIHAAREVGFKIPVVVRLEGTNVERARKLLAEANLPQLIPAADLTDAAKKACAAV
ncbi:MAG: succinate--CoA ligase [ADP-forming] subunit beta [Phycisphaerae bacterium]|nr:MAG: ADP-forming succinate--CoA ligase subunit beta [Planctomycetia bacterium]RIK67375.1 MAG: ADP-forming succinate--CoA ligase subunit beta [Planctomycetota bacterium]GJQ27550.1 MAG: succinate--CoA ligase [ADP-forming] subunit beta [Phycisphaerae bacterium]